MKVYVVTYAVAWEGICDVPFASLDSTVAQKYADEHDKLTTEHDSFDVIELELATEYKGKAVL